MGLYPHIRDPCVNAGFYLGAGNSANSSIAFPWLLSIEAFAGARLVLNLHALPFDASSLAADSRNGGILSSHIVFMTNPAASSTQTHVAGTTRWDWGGLREPESSYGSTSRSGDGSGSGSGSGTRVMESYEMNASTSNNPAARKHQHRHGKSASTTRYSDTCVDFEEGVP